MLVCVTDLGYFEKLEYGCNNTNGGYFPLTATQSGSRKRGVEFKGGSRHDRNRHNRRNRRNRQNRHGCLLVLYFLGEAEGGQGALQNRQNRQNRHEGYPP